MKQRKRDERRISDLTLNSHIQLNLADFSYDIDR